MTQEMIPVVDVKRAVQNAKKFVEDVVGTTEIRRLTLEEVELADDGKSWLVTLGLALNDPFDLLRQGQVEKSVKLFRVDTTSGAVLSMTSPDRQ
jgi:hypothetical protein